MRPDFGGGKNELTKKPKVDAFDPSMVGFACGRDPWRNEDLGLLREYLAATRTTPSSASGRRPRSLASPWKPPEVTGVTG
jgi:hypothetical protein